MNFVSHCEEKNKKSTDPGPPVKKLELKLDLELKLKLDWTNFGTGKILYMILEHSCREPEAVVKCCVRNFGNLVYCKVISRCGHRGFGLRS